MKLSIIIPVYNENKTILQVLDKLDFINYFDKEIIIVDDGSIDGTQKILHNVISQPYFIIFGKENHGKGHAIRQGLKYVTGDYVLIQDADLEYNPEDIKLLVDIMNGNDVVYGTRFHSSANHKKSFYYFGNRFLSLATSILYGKKITDMETGYKLFKTTVIKNLNLKQNRFGFEPEVTAKLLKKGYKIHEVPILYQGRSVKEGKKITWKDGVKALFILIKERLKPNR